MLSRRVVKGNVIIVVTGGEYGARGFIDAYNVSSGERAWRFYTATGPEDPKFGTWAGDSWKTGGSSIWVTGADDPELNLTYWGTGNPGPDWHGDKGAGDNVYCESVQDL